MAKSLNWKLWIGLLISALFTYAALREVDTARLCRVIQSADPVFLFLIVVITFLQYVIRAWRWAILLEPIKETGFLNRLWAVLVGFGANCIFPARLGEFIRANYLGRMERLSGSATFGTIVVERLFDGFTLLLILVIGLLFTAFPAEWHTISGSLRGTGLLLFFFYILIITLLVGFKYRAESFLRILDRVLFLVPAPFRSRMIEMIRNFSRGLVPLKNPGRWAQATLYSLLLWSSSLLQIQFTKSSIGMDLPWIAPFLIMAMASFGVMIPSAPGFIGTFHLTVQYGFIFYGIGKAEALSAAILWHAAMVFPTMLFGLVAFLALHLSPRVLSQTPLPEKEGLGKS